MLNPKTMIKSYNTLKIGDKVRFWMVRDRKKPHVEHLTGYIQRESLSGWIVKSKFHHISGVVHGITEANYIGHWAKNAKV